MPGRFAFRLVRAPFADLTGEGARLAGGRWNSPGRPAVYAAENLSLSVLEALVHMRPHRVPKDLVVLRISIPDAVPQRSWKAAALPTDWMQVGADAPRRKGDGWLEAAREAVLWVPSAIVREESNAILNPMHPDHARIRVVETTPFAFDPRLLPQ
jgi:RES domain-containing protein